MRSPFLPLLAALALFLTGCATPETIQRRSSLTAYLGAQEAPTATANTGPARLQLPLRLGIAFVPKEATVRKGHGGGFADLDQVARTFGVEVVALVGVDQVQFSSPRWYSWTYWTLVGAYMVKGDKNDTTALVDAAVYHVPSRTFLFRAGGVGTIKGSSTWSGREEAFRQQARDSLALAMTQLSTSLDQGVATFKQDILKGARKDVALIDKAGNPLGSPAYDPTRR